MAKTEQDFLEMFMGNEEIHIWEEKGFGKALPIKKTKNKETKNKDK